MAAGTVVSGWSVRPVSASTTNPPRLPVMVRTAGRGVARVVRVQRRAVGKRKWTTIVTARTDAAGAFTAVLAARAGRWQFRLSIPAGAGGASAKTGPKTVTLTRLMVSAAERYACALRVGGRVRCWGLNEDRQLGDGTATDRVRPVTVKGVSGATQIAVGDHHACALLLTGHVRCWGDNSYKQLGDGTRKARVAPVTVRGVTRARAIAAFQAHTCAVVARGRVMCWGAYQTGGEDREADEFPASKPTRVPGLTRVTALAAGSGFDCALRATGRVKCWGDNDDGQLGDGTLEDRARPVTVRNVRSATAVTAGLSHACALVSRGRIACWGSNAFHEAGDPSRRPRLKTPRIVPGLSGQTAIAVGDRFTCSAGGAGPSRCWGANQSGQLGNGKGGTNAQSATPGPVARLGSAIGLTAGSDSACAQRANHQVWCWGNNDTGQLGDGTRTSGSASPVAVAGLRQSTAIVAGPSYTCAGGPAGTVRCWGEQDPYPGSIDRPTPQLVAKLTGATTVAAGWPQTCALMADGTLRCWEAGTNGPPVTVAGLIGVAAVEAGHNTMCSILAAAGTVSCWGADWPAGRTTIAGISSATFLSAREGGACAVGAGGAVACWTPWQRTPVPLPGLPAATAVARGGAHSCALTAGGAVWCWGVNNQGQLGDGTVRNRSTPAPVPGISTAIALRAGPAHTCALLSNAAVRCWGYNEDGQLGDGTSTNRSRPVTVPGLRGATGIAVGDNHSCAALASGSARCWGSNSAGQLGMDPGWAPRPVAGL